MAVDDMVYGQDTVLDGNTMDIKPTNSGEEWVVHNIYVPPGCSVGVYSTGSIDDILIIQTPFSLIGQFNFHCNGTQYLKLQNDSGNTAVLGFDGIVVKVA